MDVLKSIINSLCRPEIYFVIVSAWWLISLLRPGWWVGSKRFALMMTLLFALYLFALSDENFRLIAFKGDNIPIIFMLFMLVFFTWVGFGRGHENDLRRVRGEPLIEVGKDGEEERKVLVWPHLLYLEVIVGTFATVLLIVWSITIPAPLEEPANAAHTPNPSKAPWYFLGLQELLVYFDPWLAGVVAPSLIILGLMAIPYLDKNPKGNGYYTLAERRFAIGGFTFGFLVLWVSLIVVGTVFRGPNWNFFGPFEPWDAVAQPVLNNINLSEVIFLRVFGVAMPGHWLGREIFGIALLLAYFLGLPPLLTRLALFRKLRAQMGLTRYAVFCFLFLSMLAFPIKMGLRWTLNLKYIVAIPEHFFNI